MDTHISRRPRTRVRLVAMSVALAFAAAIAVAPPAHAAFCAQVWGSQPRSAGDMSAGDLVDVRAGQHACFDRLVMDVADARLTGWSVRYVDHVRQDGSGQLVPVRGGARLEVNARVPLRDPGTADSFFTGVDHPVVVSGYRTFRQVAWAGSFEGVSRVGLGVRARLPFRAFVLPGPGAGSRLVVDVGHRW